MKSTLDKWGVKGRVKSIHHKKFDVERIGTNKPNIIEDVTSNDFVTFNQKGFIIKRKNFEVDLKFYYKISENEFTVHEHGENNKVIEIGKCTINENGDDLQYLRYSSDEICYDERTYKYNKKGNLIQENLCNSEGNLVEYLFYEYNGCSSLQKLREFMFGEEWRVTKYRYNLNDDFTEDVVEKKILYLDENNKSSSYTVKYKYDTDRNVISEQYLDEFKFITNTYTLSWFFDIHDNWVKKVAYKGGKEAWFEERTILYYGN